MVGMNFSKWFNSIFRRDVRPLHEIFIEKKKHVEKLLLVLPWGAVSSRPLLTPSGINLHWKTEWSAPPVLNTH